MKMLTKNKLITCILGKDNASQLADYLHEECAIHTAHFAHARGQYSGNHNAHSWKEKDILQVMVAEDKADDVFQKIFFFLELDKQPSGFIFQEDLILSSQFVLPLQESL